MSEKSLFDDNPDLPFDQFRRPAVEQPSTAELQAQKVAMLSGLEIAPTTNTEAGLPPSAAEARPAVVQQHNVVGGDMAAGSVNADRSRLAAQPKPAIRLDIGGALRPMSFDEIWRLASCYAKAGLLPKAYDTPEKVVVAMQFCAEFRLPFVIAVRQIAVINGSPSMWGDLPLSVVQQSGQLQDIQEYYLDADGKPIADDDLRTPVFAARCVTHRLRPDGGVRTRTTTFSMADAKLAGLASGAVWAKYPKRMLQMRTRGHNLKDNFADVLNGASIAEYDHGVQPDSGDHAIEVGGGAADQLNQRYVENRVAPPPANG